MRRRPIGILVLLASTSLVALAGGWTLMFYAAWTILFLLVAAYVLSIIGLRALYFERRTRARVQHGDDRAARRPNVVDVAGKLRTFW